MTVGPSSLPIRLRAELAVVGLGGGGSWRLAALGWLGGLGGLRSLGRLGRRAAAAAAARRWARLAWRPRRASPASAGLARRLARPGGCGAQAPAGSRRRPQCRRTQKRSSGHAVMRPMRPPPWCRAHAHAARRRGRADATPSGERTRATECSMSASRHSLGRFSAEDRGPAALARGGRSEDHGD